MIRPSCSDAPGLLRLFVYGTLKRGYWNHDRFCGGAVSIKDAAVRGRLYELPSGIPVLEIPEEDVLCAGTDNPFADARTQAHTNMPTDISDLSGWHSVHGELITFDDPLVSLPPVDRLEGFVPNGVSLYHRVLVPVRPSDECSATAWCYVASRALLRDAKPTGRASWP